MIRVALAQLNLVVGDVDGNVSRIKEAMRRADEAGAQVLALPELATTGYPPEDLLHKRSFLEANLAAMDEIAAHSNEALTVAGYVDLVDEALYNAAAVCHRGKLIGTYHKQLLPNYGVFDERRHFTSGTDHLLLETPEGVIGVCVCEDAWSDPGPLISQGDAGAQVVININASPYHKNKFLERCRMLGDRARRARASIVYVNLVGGQDELIFDGGSVVVSHEGDVVARCVQFEETFAVVDVPLGEVHGSHNASVRKVPLQLRRPSGSGERPMAPELDDAEEVYRALTLALRDYVAKNGFDKVVIGLSGGIDSTLTAVIAADALGADKVLGVAMPSEFSSQGSIDDALALASNLGIEVRQIGIADIYRSYVTTMARSFGDQEMGLAEENIQARIRGNLLMAISNRYGHLVLATGNKSEMACGYATLYGDMAGGLAVLKDVFKTEVYDLCRYRNSVSAVIPETVMTKPPSAELRPNQKDSDSLPPYYVLDPILEDYIERDMAIDDMVTSGHDRATVEKVVALVDRAEYKRRQAAPGPKVTTKAFGRDRRLPITNRWRESGRRTLPERSVGRGGSTDHP